MVFAISLPKRISNDSILPVSNLRSFGLSEAYLAVIQVASPSASYYREVLDVAERSVPLYCKVFQEATSINAVFGYS